MTNISPSLIDVDPDQWRPGHPFGGFIETEEDRSFGSAFPDALLIPRREWKDRIRQRKEYGVSLLNYAMPKNDQTPESSCVYNATEAAWRAIWIKCGYPELHLSPMSGYIRVTRRRHSGSYMWEAGEQLRDYGLLPENTTENKRLFHHTFHQNTPFVQRERLPDGWEETAQHFRADPDDWMRIDSSEQFASAVLNDFPVVYGRRGHSICAMDLVWSRGKPLIEYLDSYGTKGGRSERGTLYDSESRWATGGAWALRAVRLPDDPDRPAGDDGK